ncbi:MAG: CPBP family intramembrane metalloprotease [Clostridia bacterium]|nr:CPBP family intramembrane metalloprotease [Clostridia bacterium]
MSQENMFENPEWQPSGNYGKFDEVTVKEARGAFSRFCLSLFLYLLIANAIVFAITAVMALVMGDSANAFLESNPVIQMIISTVPMYLVSFPVLYLIVRGMPSHKREKKKLSALELFYTFLVAEAFMMAGNLIGQSLNASISNIFGIEINNTTADLITEAPIWLVFILVVILAPIVEELIFRKLMIDKLSRYGDTVAIIVSAVAFGLFHGNFYQFFYAAFLGLLLGYVYCKSGKVKYTIIYHMIINFLGSVAVIPLLKYEELLMSGAIPETGAALGEFFTAVMAMGSYAVIQYAMVIAGVVVFFNAIKYRMINVNRNAEIRIPRGRTAGAVLLNVGSMLFLAFSLLTFVASIFLG